MLKPGFLLQILPVMVIALAAFVFIVLKTLSRFKPREDAGSAASWSNEAFPQNRTAPGLETIDGVFPVTVQTGRGGFTARAKEISLAGAFIICDRPLPVGEPLELSLELAEPLSLRATVTWNNDSVPGEEVVLRGMRVRFLDLPEKARSALGVQPAPPNHSPDR